MREAALAPRAREAGLDRLDDPGCAVGDDQERIAEAAGAHVLEERAHRLGILLGAGHQVQQDLGPARREAPGGEDRLAPLPRPDALGDAVDEQIDDVVLTEIARGEVPIVGPQPLAHLRDRRPGEQKPSRTKG